MKIAVILAALFLSGCASTGFRDVEVVTETRYITRIASEAQKKLPPLPPNINVETATQSDLAQWLLLNEEYILNLQALIRQLILFYEAKPTEEEKKAAEPTKK
jgi:hypothetical protein